MKGRGRNDRFSGGVALGFDVVVCLLIFGLAFAVMVVSAWVQHRRGAKETTNFHGSVAVEVCWAPAPLVIVSATGVAPPCGRCWPPS